MKRFELGRLFRIYKKIKDCKYQSVKDLARDEEVSERTIKRDISTLKYSLNAPIGYSKKYKGYYLEKDWEFPFPPLTAGEILALFIANNLIKNLKDTPLHKISSELSKKLERLLPDNILMSNKEIENILSISFQPIKLKKDIIKTFEIIFDAIREKKRLKIKYYTIKRDDISERKIDPYHLFNFEGIWYVVAFCHLRNEIRDFALDRILDIKLLNEKFEIIDGFNIENYLKSSFRIYKGGEEEITLHFDKYQARWIKERIWHESQKIEELSDGSLILKIKGNREEIKRWIIGYGSHVK
ncbi:MAG: WYL domain-containing transcriptional regulator, partial [Caldisericia bacterium]|nr:WYL domain-containing transcriptional regulator [Caldisericia bacterium]